MTNNKRMSPEGTITLGGFIELLKEWVEQKEKEAGGKKAALQYHVYFDFASAVPATLDSYRGYFYHLALGYEAGGEYTATKLITVEELLKELKEAIGKTYSGWKGGDFKMNLKTPVWVDNPGHCSGTLILGLRSDTYSAIIHTCNEEDILK